MAIKTFLTNEDELKYVQSINGVVPDENGNVNVETTGGSNVVVDTALSDTSVNPVQNKVLKTALDEKQEKNFVVNGTPNEDGSQCTSDKSYNEIVDAYMAGKTVVMYMDGLYVPMQPLMDDKIRFQPYLANEESIFFADVYIAPDAPNTVVTTAGFQAANASSVVPNTRKINNKDLTADITLTASDVGADPEGKYIEVLNAIGPGALTWDGHYEDKESIIIAQDESQILRLVRVTDEYPIGLSLLDESAETIVTINQLGRAVEIITGQIMSIQPDGFGMVNLEGFALYVVPNDNYSPEEGITLNKGVYFMSLNAVTPELATELPYVYISGLSIPYCPFKTTHATAQPDSDVDYGDLIVTTAGTNTITFDKVYATKEELLADYPVAVPFVSDTQYFCKVSNMPLNNSDLENGITWWNALMSEPVFIDYTELDISSEGFNNNSFIINIPNMTLCSIIEDNTSVIDFNIIFPEKGTYILLLIGASSLSCSCTIHGANKFNIKEQINNKYLPDDIGGGVDIVVDDALSSTSTNPVQNKVIYEELSKKAELPTVTASDNGKFLVVTNGVWTAVAVPDAEGVSF